MELNRFARHMSGQIRTPHLRRAAEAALRKASPVLTTRTNNLRRRRYLICFCRDMRAAKTPRPASRIAMRPQNPARRPVPPVEGNPASTASDSLTDIQPTPTHTHKPTGAEGTSCLSAPVGLITAYLLLIWLYILFSRTKLRLLNSPAGVSIKDSRYISMRLSIISM